MTCYRKDVMQLKPINANIVAEVDNEAEKTEQGILIPQVKGERSDSYAIRCVIIDIASDIDELKEDPENPGKYKRDTIKIKKGDKVLVAKWEGQKAVLDGKNLIIIKQKDILGILSE